MDIRVSNNKLVLYEVEELNKEEVEFLMTLLNTGKYWELRDAGDSYTLHDKGNFKRKGTLKELDYSVHWE